MIAAVETSGRSYECADCGETHITRAEGGPLPKRCPECKRLFNKERHRRQYSPTPPRNQSYVCGKCGETHTDTGKGRPRKYCPDCVTPKVYIRNCRGCGEMFATSQSRQQNCKKGCDRRTTLTCEWCGEDFTGTIPRGGDHRTGRAYCSQECLGADRRVSAEPIPWTNCHVCEARYIRRARAKCPTCNPEPLGPHRSISDQPRTRFIFVSGNCQECQEPFVGRTTTLTHIPIHCSDTCSRRAWRRVNGNGEFNSRGRRTTRRTGARYQPISRSKVLDDDGYVCHICGLDTDPDAPVSSDRYPSVDHVIPLSKGGDHTYDNVRCACFRCNAVKRDTVGHLFMCPPTPDGTAPTPRPQAEKSVCEMGGSD